MSRMTTKKPVNANIIAAVQRRVDVVGSAQFIAESGLGKSTVFAFLKTGEATPGVEEHLLQAATAPTRATTTGFFLQRAASAGQAQA